MNWSALLPYSRRVSNTASSSIFPLNFVLFGVGFVFVLVVRRPPRQLLVGLPHGVSVLLLFVVGRVLLLLPFHILLPVVLVAVPVRGVDDIDGGI